MTSDTTVSAPAPTATELALQQEQLATLQQQRQIQDLTLRFLFEESGFDPVFDDEGNLIDLTRRPGTVAEQLQEEVLNLSLERAKNALLGQLEVDPALLKDLDLAEQGLRGQLLRDLGPDFATSTPGIEALGRFGERKDLALSAARRGDLTTANQISLERGLEQSGGIDQTLQRLFGIGNIGSGTFGATNQLSQLLAQNRDRTLQADIINSQSRASTINAIFGAAGQIAGVAGGIGLSKALT